MKEAVACWGTRFLETFGVGTGRIFLGAWEEWHETWGLLRQSHALALPHSSRKGCQRYRHQPIDEQDAAEMNIVDREGVLIVMDLCTVHIKYPACCTNPWTMSIRHVQYCGVTQDSNYGDDKDYMARIDCFLQSKYLKVRQVPSRFAAEIISARDGCRISRLPKCSTYCV